MKWFEGNIADAVTASKSTNAIFVVYVEGNDEMSRAMTSALDSSSITADLSSSKFVCIKLSKDSESHRQFTEIYKIVPVPSLFFIGESGVPLEIVAGDNAPENAAKKITSSISKIKGEPQASTSPASPSPSQVAASSPSPSGNQLSKDGSPPVSSSSSQSSLGTAYVASAPPEEVVGSPPREEQNKAAELDRVQDLIKKKREEHEKEDQEKEKERELSRRKMGKEISQARKSQQERELEELRREREKDRKLEAEARQRVLRQIEEDKANRAARNQALAGTNPPVASVNSAKPVEKPPSPVSQANEARIQFKLPDGQTRTQSFPSSTTLRDLRSYIDSNIEIPFKEYTLATTFPRREFASRDLNRNLVDLELIPSSVLLILPVQGNMSVSRGPGWTSTLSAMLWALLQPVFDIGAYLRSLISGDRGQRPEPSSDSNPPEQEPSSSSQTEEPLQPSRQPYYSNLGGGKSVRKRGNVHTLSDGNDSNDENNTWNGNSTQLM